MYWVLERRVLSDTWSIPSSRMNLVLSGILKGIGENLCSAALKKVEMDERLDGRGVWGVGVDDWVLDQLMMPLSKINLNVIAIRPKLSPLKSHGVKVRTYRDTVGCASEMKETLLLADRYLPL